MDATGCHGRIVWPAAEALATALTRCHEQWVRSVRAVEIGAGLGVPGLLLAKRGCECVTLTDYHPLVIEALRQTVTVNGLGGRCAVGRLDWEATHPAVDVDPGPWTPDPGPWTCPMVAVLTGVVFEPSHGTE